MGGFECGADVAVKGAHEDRICCFSIMLKYRDGPSRCGRGITESEKRVLARTVCRAFSAKSSRNNRRSSTSAVRTVAESCEIPAIIGSDRGRTTTIMCCSETVREIRQGLGAPERPRRPPTDGERRGLGLQQELYTIYTSVGLRASSRSAGARGLCLGLLGGGHFTPTLPGGHAPTE